MNGLRRVLTGFAVLPLLASLGVAGSAAAWSGGSHGDRGDRFEAAVARLGLKESTLHKVYAVLDAARSKHRQLREELIREHQKMRTLLEQNQPDEGAIMKQADAIGALRTEAAKERLHTMLAVRALLTPEQRTQLREMMQAHRHHHGWGGHSGARSGPGGPPSAR